MPMNFRPSQNFFYAKQPLLPVRVLHVFKSSHQQSMGGVENAIRQMVYASSMLGMENTILCIGGKNRPANNNGDAETPVDANRDCRASIIACPASLSYDSIAFSRLMFGRFKALVREHDLVHYHYPFPQQDLMHLFVPAPACRLFFQGGRHRGHVRQLSGFKPRAWTL